MFKNWEKINAENWSSIFILSIFAGFVGIVICNFFSFLLFHVHAYGSLVVMSLCYVVFSFCGFILSVTFCLVNIRSFEEQNPTIAEFAQSDQALYQRLSTTHSNALKPHCPQCGAEMRIKTPFRVISYDPDTGRPNKKKLKVFCKNETETGEPHQLYSIILDGENNPVQEGEPTGEILLTESDASS